MPLAIIVILAEEGRHAPQASPYWGKDSCRCAASLESDRHFKTPALIGSERLDFALRQSKRCVAVAAACERMAIFFGSFMHDISMPIHKDL